MKTTKAGCVRFPKLYRAFKNSQEIADTINRSPAYVKKAMRTGFTDREKKMLEEKAKRELFDD